MTRVHKIILSILGVGILILCILVSSAGYQLWQQPLGPELDLPTQIVQPTFPPTWTPLGGNANAQEAPTYPATATPIELTETPTPKAPLCGGPEKMIILLIGSSHRVNSYLYGLADAIRLVRVDFVNANVKIMSLPRDLYVEIPDISDHYGITHGKLNQAYFFGNPGMAYYDGPGEGPGLMARTLSYNFGARPDHYVAVNMAVFTQIVDAVGGITVDLPQAVDARYADNPDNRRNIFFPAGINHLNSDKALLLARLRPYGVFERVKTQNEVLCGLYDQLVSPSVVGNIPSIINAFKDNVQTDLSSEEISQLTCLGTQLSGSDITFLNWDEDMFVGTRLKDATGADLSVGASIWDVDFNLLRSYIAAFERGEWLAPAPSSSSGSGDSAPESFCD